MMSAVLAWLIGTPAGRVLVVAAAASFCVWFGLRLHADHVEQRVRADIERQNQERANAAGNAARNVGDCYSVGGKWVQSEGRCVMPRVPGASP